MRGLPPAGVRIDPAIIERLRTWVRQLAALPPQAREVRQTREVLKFCAASDAIPEDLKVQASRLLFASPPGARESIMTENAAGEWVHTIFVDCSGGSDWYYAVKHADEGEPAELRALLLAPDADMTNEGRALLSDFVWRYGIKGRFNRSWDMKARAQLARAEWKKRRARPATPIYARSDLDVRIDCALAELRASRRVFGRARVPVEHMAELWGISASTLQNALEGRRGSEQRKAARRKKPMPRPADRGKG